MPYYQSRTLKKVLIVQFRTMVEKKEVNNLKEKINFLEAESNVVEAENDNQMKDDYDDYYITMKTSLEIKSILKKLQV